MILPLLFSLSVATAPSTLPAASAPTVTSPTVRLLAEGAGGGLGMVGGAFVGYAAGSYLACAAANNEGWCFLNGWPGLLAGAALGTSLGVQLGGHLTDGRGAYLGTLAGAAVGAGAGLAVYFVTANATRYDSTAMVAATAAAAGLTLAGGVAGYEIGHRLRIGSASALLLPTFGPDGGGLALSGSF